MRSSNNRSAESGPPSTDHGTVPIKKMGSFKSLFSLFRRSKSSAVHVPKTSNHYSKKECIDFSVLSTVSLPGHGISETYDSKTSSPQWTCEQATVSCVSLPSHIQPPFSNSTSPTSSSSSASSLEFGSDASTAATTPSSSSPCVLIKSSSTYSPPLPSDESNTPQRSVNIQPAKKLKRPENYLKKPSPLSKVTGVQSSPYILPVAPLSTVSHDSTRQKRKNSLSRLLSRKSQSNPNLLKPFDGDDVPPVTSIPVSVLPVHPATANGSSLRQRSLWNPLKDPSLSGKPTSYTVQEKIDRQSILGADPAGLGFYLYPKAQPETIKIGTRSKLDGKRNSWSGPSSSSEGLSSSCANGRRSWREARGRSFGRNVAPDIIEEEEGSDAHVASSELISKRRYSELPTRDNQWILSPGPVLHIPAKFPRTNSQQMKDGQNSSTKNLIIEKPRVRGPHNCWDYLNAQMKLHNGDLSFLQVPPRETLFKACGMPLGEEEETLRNLQHDAMQFMIATAELGGEAAMADNGWQVGEAGEPNGILFIPEIMDKLEGILIPMVKVEMVDV